MADEEGKNAGRIPDAEQVAEAAVNSPAPVSAVAQPEAVAAPKKETESAYPFSVTVGRVYDGPLDLLLDLIRKQDIDIYDIPIAKITAQFLAYIEHLKETDVDAAGDFIYTAALLIHIKSRMLLPRSPAETAGDDGKILAVSWWSGCWSTSDSRMPRRCSTEKQQAGSGDMDESWHEGIS